MTKTVIKSVKGGGIDITLLCECGKPIILTNGWGMFCEDKCGEEESKKAYKVLSTMFPTIFKDLA